MSRMTPKPLCLLASLAISVFGAGLAAAADVVAEDSELAKARAKIHAMFAEIAPENVDTSPVDGWYTVHKGSIIAYVSADGRYLLQGDLIDLDLNLNLSEQTRTKARRELMSSVGDDQVITFSPAEVKHSVTIFTDVDCAYCRKLHSEIDGYLANGIEIRYVLYPRNGPASPSWNTSEDVWCASNKNEALTAAKLDHGFETQKCKTTAITDNYTLGRNVGLTGTPAIVLDDGTLLSGYLPPKDLSQLLSQQSAAN